VWHAPSSSPFAHSQPDTPLSLSVLLRSAFPSLHRATRYRRE
jgi:hypothetical protein